MIKTVTLPCADLPAGATEDLDLDPATTRLVMWLDTVGLHPHVFELPGEGNWGVVFDNHVERGLWGLLTIDPGTGALVRADWTDDDRDFTNYPPRLVQALLLSALP